jgi:hypothetical protein
MKTGHIGLAVLLAGLVALVWYVARPRDVQIGDYRFRLPAEHRPSPLAMPSSNDPGVHLRLPLHRLYHDPCLDGQCTILLGVSRGSTPERAEERFLPARPGQWSARLYFAPVQADDGTTVLIDCLNARAQPEWTKEQVVENGGTCTLQFDWRPGLRGTLMLYSKYLPRWREIHAEAARMVNGWLVR